MAQQWLSRSHVQWRSLSFFIVAHTKEFLIKPLANKYIWTAPSQPDTKTYLDWIDCPFHFSPLRRRGCPRRSFTAPNALPRVQDFPDCLVWTLVADESVREAFQKSERLPGARLQRTKRGTFGADTELIQGGGKATRVDLYISKSKLQKFLRLLSQ